MSELRPHPVTAPKGAVSRWDSAIASWVIPERILSQAPESPYADPPAMFQASSGRVTVATERLARAGLGVEGTVLDVGSGGGIACMALAPHARLVVGVDMSTGMLANFAEAAVAAGVAHREVVGRWPDVAPRLACSSVVLCRNVVYSVGDIGPFVTALADRATNRVVVELSTHHPGVVVAPLWKRFWGRECPAGPTADDFVEVVRELGFDPVVAKEPRPRDTSAVKRERYVAFLRRRLCLPAEREPEIDAALGPELPQNVAVTVGFDIGERQ